MTDKTGESDMRIAVCCKGIPIDPAVESTQVTDGYIQFTDTDFYINEFDSYSLEAALTLKSRVEAETIALSLGPLRVQEVLHFAIAKGIDKVMRIDGETSCPELIASGLASVLKNIDPQLVLVGVQSEDWMGGEVGVYLSQALDMSLAYAVTEIGGLTDSHVRITKELGGGRTAEIMLTIPAVLCIQTGIQPLRYISGGKLRKALKTPIPLGGSLDLEDAKKRVSPMMAYDIVDVTLPSRETHAEIITGERSEKAAKLLEIIRKII